MNLPEETERGIYMPVQVYPMFETALRAASGRSVEEHDRHLGKLWSDLSHVAADNEYAWIRDAKSPEEITTVTASNRMIGFPYPKYMNSNNDVDMGAAIIMCSVEAARRLGVPEDRWVFPHSGPTATSTRSSPTATRSPVLRRSSSVARRPSSSRASASTTSQSSTSTRASRQRCSSARRRSASTSIAPVVAHRRAAVRWRTVEQLRDARDRQRRRPTCASSPTNTAWSGPTAATPRSMRSACTRPTRRATPFRHEKPQDEIDRLPRRELALPADAAGPATIEAYTVMFSRDGEPEQPIASCLLADGRRAWGSSTDADTAAAMCDGEQRRRRRHPRPRRHVPPELTDPNHRLRRDF